jgi:hypothetical protein
MSVLSWCFPAIAGQILLVLLLSLQQALHLHHEQARYGAHRLWYLLYAAKQLSAPQAYSLDESLSD